MMLHMRPLLVPIFALCLFGCDEDQVANSVGGVNWATASNPLAFGPVLVGESAGRTIEFINTARSPRWVEISSTGPFTVSSGLELGAGEVRAVTVEFRPDVAGDVRGAVRILVENETAELGLTGFGVERGVCGSSEPCVRSDFDPASRTCVSRAIADGTGCSAVCIEAGTCQAGRCVGLQRGCDDGNPCTADACDSHSGCVHLPAECRPSGPCMAPSCDPLSGCTLTPVVDGASCGRRGCDVQDVCIAGICTALAPPDGAACGEESFCQDLGRCIAGSCEVPPRRTLNPVWKLSPSNHELRFRGLQDRFGNLYLSRQAEGREELVSLTPDGRLRFAVELLPPPEPLPPEEYWRSRERLMAIVGGSLISSRARVPDPYTWPTELAARRIVDGALIWTADVEAPVAPLLQRSLYDGDALVGLGSVFETANGNPAAIIMGVYANGSGGFTIPETFWLEFDAQTGAVVSNTRLVRRVGGSPIHDGRRALYRIDHSGNSLESISTLDSSSNWIGAPGRFVRPLAATDELVIAGRDEIESSAGIDWACRHQFWGPYATDASTGASSGPLQWRTRKRTAWAQGGRLPDPLLVARDTDVWLVGWPTSEPCDAGHTPPSLVALHGRSGSENWRVELRGFNDPDTDFSSLQLTNRSSLLLLREEQNGDSSDNYLLEVGLDGQLRFECRLDASTSSPAYLTRGFIVVDTGSDLRGYALPGYDLEPSAWSRGTGNSQHTRTAR